MPSTQTLRHIKDILRNIYSKTESECVLKELKNLMDVYGKSELVLEKRRKYNNRVCLTEKDVFLITYPDTINTQEEKPLSVLYGFLQKYLKNTIDGAHILPFFPSSSDFGYSVINYKKVDQRLGACQKDRKRIPGHV